MTRWFLLVIAALLAVSTEVYAQSSAVTQCDNTEPLSWSAGEVTSKINDLLSQRATSLMLCIRGPVASSGRLWENERRVAVLTMWAAVAEDQADATAEYAKIAAELKVYTELKSPLSNWRLHGTPLEDGWSKELTETDMLRELNGISTFYLRGRLDSVGFYGGGF